MDRYYYSTGRALLLVVVLVVVVVLELGVSCCCWCATGAPGGMLVVLGYGVLVELECWWSVGGWWSVSAGGV